MFWKLLHKHALRNARRALSLESRERVVIAFIGAVAVIAALALLGSEGAAKDEIIFRTVLACSVLFLFPVFYVIKFATGANELWHGAQTELAKLRESAPSIIYLPSAPYEYGSPIKHFSVSVKNNGSKALDNCSVKLCSAMDANGVEHVKIPFSLKRRKHESSNFYLRPGEQEFVDVASLNEQEETSLIKLMNVEDAVKPPGRSYTRIPRGTYTIRLEAYSSESGPATNYFSLYIDEQGKLRFDLASPNHPSIL